MIKEAWIHGYKVITMDDWTFEKDDWTYMYVCIQHFKSGARWLNSLQALNRTASHMDVYCA